MEEKMNENEKKEDSKKPPLSYMWRLYYNIAFLSDEIAGCINCCYNFDPLRFAIILDRMYNGLSDDEKRAICERKPLSIFSDKNIIDIPDKEILPSSRKKIRDKNCLIFGIPVSWYCSDPIELQKILIEITNEKCSSEKIPNECKKKQEAEEAKKAENAEEVKEAEDTKEVQKLNNNAAVCQDTEENNSAEQVLNEKKRLFYAVLFLAFLFQIENDTDLYMTIGEFEKFRGLKSALNSPYEKGLRYAVNNKLKVYKQAIEAAGISGLYEIKTVQAGKKEKYCPVDLFIAEWLYLNDEKDKDNDEGDRKKERIPLLYIFDLIYEKKGMFKKTLSRGKYSTLTIDNALRGYIEIINRICDMEDPKEFTLAFFAFFKFEMTHHFSSLILFADYWKENLQEQFKCPYEDFTDTENPNYAIKMYERILSPFGRKDSPIDPAKKDNEKSSLDSKENEDEKSSSSSAKIDDLKVFPSPFTLDLPSCLNNIFNSNDRDFALVRNLMFRFASNNVYNSILRAEDFRTHKITDEDFEDFYNTVMIKWGMKEVFEGLKELLGKIESVIAGGSDIYKRIERLTDHNEKYKCILDYELYPIIAEKYRTIKDRQKNKQ